MSYSWSQNVERKKGFNVLLTDQELLKPNLEGGDVSQKSSCGRVLGGARRDFFSWSCGLVGLEAFCGPGAVFRPNAFSSVVDVGG